MSIRRHIRLALSSALPLETEDAVVTEALRTLQQEQRLIADELERTFLAYDKTLQEAAKRLAAAGEQGVTPQEQEQLQREQLALWRLVRRAQAAQRTTRELAREVEEWKAHGPTAVSEGHPDHPDTRVEIAESELRVRGVMVAERSSHVSSVIPLETEEVMETSVEDEAVPVPSASAWDHETDERLVQEIYQHQRELLRASSASDIAELLRSLRSLHAHLRLHDRRVGRPRLRWRMGLESALFNS